MTELILQLTVAKHAASELRHSGDKMIKQLIMICCILGLAQVGSAKIVVSEITPLTAAEVKWTVTTQLSSNKTTFSVAIPFKGNVFPPGTSAQLDVLNGTNLVSTSILQLQVLDGKSCFVFTVSNKYLQHSKFSLTKLDVPHPSGDILWINLGKFAEKQGNQTPEPSSGTLPRARVGHSKVLALDDVKIMKEEGPNHTSDRIRQPAAGYTSSAPLLSTPPDVPVEARPVWLSCKAIEIDDFSLFCEVRCTHTRDFLDRKYGLQTTFTQLKSSTRPNLASTTYVVTNMIELADVGLVRLKENYALIKTTHDTSSGGSLVMRENGVWKIASPGRLAADAAIVEQTPAVGIKKAEPEK